MLAQAVTGKTSQLNIVDGQQAAKVSPKPLFGLDRDALSRLMADLGEPAWRGRQLAEAIYAQRLTSLEAITTLPLALRRRLTQESWEIARPTIEQVFRSVDGTERYLVQGQPPATDTVETVWMPEGDEGESGDGTDTDGNVRPWDRATICVSSQVGCAVNCQFCLTARLGVQRNLTAGEIAGQVAAVLNRHQVAIGRDRINLVFMGMGEPFLNYDNLMAAVHLLVEGMGIPVSRMTVSTSGILPGLERYATEAMRPKLALSLNAPNDSIRQSIMPITRKWNIDALLTALRAIPLRPRERVTLEYVLLGGVNDRREDALELAALLRGSGLPAKVNLIAWNPGPEIPYRMPDPEDVAAFQKLLQANGVPAFLRRPRGRDIYAACGQLKRTLE
jgi:23S rRNA (adenine2503-C2)-methyltransferase